MEHSTSEHHLKAIGQFIIKGQTSLEDTISKQRKETKEDILLGNFRTIYYLAKNALPIACIDDEKSNGIYELQTLNNAKIHSCYQSRKQANEILDYIAYSIELDIISQLEISMFFSLELDGSTDITKKAQLAICIRYVVSLQIQEHFIQLTELEAENANIITEKIFIFLRDFNLIRKLIAIATDGAPVMISDKNGVFGRLLEKYPYLKAIHCLPHRINLCLTDCTVELKEFRKLEETLYHLINFLYDSSKRKKLFKEIELEVQYSEKALLKPFDIR